MGARPRVAFVARAPRQGPSGELSASPEAARLLEALRNVSSFNLATFRDMASLALGAPTALTVGPVPDRFFVRRVRPHNP